MQERAKLQGQSRHHVYLRLCLGQEKLGGRSAGLLEGVIVVVQLVLEASVP